MEFFEDNPNFEINLKSNEENGRASKKSINSHRISGIKHNKTSPRKDQNQDILMYNINMDSQDIDIVGNSRNNENKGNSTDNDVSLSQSKSNKSDELLLKLQKMRKINNLMGELKPKNNYQLSPNTNIKLFGDLLPGPGQYYNPDVKIGQNSNYRYHNLYKDTEPNLTLKYKMIKDFYYNSKVGPGSYNPDNGVIYKSYSQNPRIFISKLGRTPLFKNNNTVGPGQYNLSKDYNKETKAQLTNQFKTRSKLNPITGNQFSQRDFNIFNTFNNNNFDNIFDMKLKGKETLNSNLNTSLNKSLNQSMDKSDGKRSRGASGKKYIKGDKNFSWKGTPDFSYLGIKDNEKENRIIFQNEDKINYKKQNFNFENQSKLNLKSYDFSQDTRKRLHDELSGFNKLYPLIQNVQRDLSLKGNHIPGPCYYNYTNNSIEGDMLKLNKRIKNNNYKNWK